MTIEQIISVIEKLCIKPFGKKAVIAWDLPSLAQQLLEKCGIYKVDPRLALAQGILEGHFGCNPAASRSRKTKNLWNVGNVDSGGNWYFQSWGDGMNAYLRVLAREYCWRLEGDTVTPEMMIRHDFTRPRGGRYATAPSYTKDIEGIVKKIDQIIQGDTK